MPLKGVKVLELAGLAPAPFCGMVLADFGASVIRVDRVGPLGIPDPLGHGKRSIALNLKSQPGVDILKKLSHKSDVLIDPFRRGVMENLQIGPNDLMKTNERLIYARLTGFGQNGSFADMAGHDINYIGLSGLLSLLGRRNQKPTPPVNLVADFGGGGLMCAFGIVVALLERSKSNLGQVIDASMVQGSAYLGSWCFRSRSVPLLWGNERGENLLDTGSHFYDTYETKDKQYMCVGALEPQFYSTFIQKLGVSEDEIPHFGNFEENRTKLEEIFKQKTQAQWCAIFDGTDACVTPMLNIEQAAHHEHNRATDTFKVTDDGVVPNPAPCLSRTPGQSMATKVNPKPGEHTAEILKELNFQPNEITSLILTGIVQQESMNPKL